MTVPRAFEHVALLYEDDHDLVDALDARIAGDLDAGAAVLLCVSAELQARVAARCRDAYRLTFHPGDDRYARPIGAMSALWDFARRSQADGATYAHTIGELTFGGGDDAAWCWYEAACNAVLADLPLTATCLYDTRSSSDLAITCAHVNHPVVHVDGAPGPSAHFGAAAPVSEPPAVEPLARPSDISHDLVTSAKPLRDELRHRAIETRGRAEQIVALDGHAHVLAGIRQLELETLLGAQRLEPAGEPVVQRLLRFAVAERVEPGRAHERIRNPPREGIHDAHQTGLQQRVLGAHGHVLTLIEHGRRHSIQAGVDVHELLIGIRPVACRRGRIDQRTNRHAAFLREPEQQA
jgi:hypothetical protein